LIEWIHELCVLSLPVFILFLWFPGSEQAKNLPGKNPLPVLSQARVILNFALQCQYIFFEIFYSGQVAAEPAQPNLLIGLRLTVPIAVCVDGTVPVASGAWHALVWAKALAH
jgi:hypothetical protein